MSNILVYNGCLETQDDLNDILFQKKKLMKDTDLQYPHVHVWT